MALYFGGFLNDAIMLNAHAGHVRVWNHNKLIIYNSILPAYLFLSWYFERYLHVPSSALITMSSVCKSEIHSSMAQSRENAACGKEGCYCIGKVVKYRSLRWTLNPTLAFESLVQRKMIFLLQPWLGNAGCLFKALTLTLHRFSTSRELTYYTSSPSCHFIIFIDLAAFQSQIFIGL